MAAASCGSRFFIAGCVGLPFDDDIRLYSLLMDPVSLWRQPMPHREAQTAAI